MSSASSTEDNVGNQGNSFQMMDIQAAVFDMYGKSIFELQGFPVKFQITAYKEVYSSLRCVVYFLLILKVRMSLKNALHLSIPPGCLS